MLMLISSGWGILVPAIFLGALILFQMGVDWIWGADTYTTNDWPKQYGTVIAAFAVSLVGWLLNKKRVLLIDEETETTLELRPAHSLFFIPMQYWGLIILASIALIYSIPLN